MLKKKNTVSRINKQISKTSRAMKSFLKVKEKLELANEKLSFVIQDSTKKVEAYKEAAAIENELQEIATERIAENMLAIDRIRQLTGEK